jgi:hypothetical protein
MLDQQGPQNNYEARMLHLAMEQPRVAQAQTFTHRGQRALIACGRDCHLAWGVESRPKNEANTLFLSDSDLDNQTPPCFTGKPDNGLFCKWCADSCERSTIAQIGDLPTLPDFDAPVLERLKYNAPVIPPDMAEGLKLIYKDLINHRPGWVVQHVADSPGVLGFCYTIGLWQSFRHPEIFISHLRPAASAAILNATAKWITANPTQALPVNTPILKVGQYSMMLAEIPTDAITGRHFAMAMDWYDGTDGNPKFQMHQLIWPDRWNRMPGDPRYNPEAPQELLTASTKVIPGRQDYIFKLGVLPQ